MAAFDNNQNKEKSAFDDDDGGDLGSDIDDDLPKIGGMDMTHKSQINRGMMGGLEMGVRNQSLQEEESK